MIFLAALLFFAAEVVAFVAVAHAIGFLWALLLLIVVSALGPFVVRRVGLGVLAHTQERLGRGEIPTRELLDGLVILIGGVMICVPGFIGDALGLLLMIGPVRHVLIRMVGHRLARRAPAPPATPRFAPRPGRRRDILRTSLTRRNDRTGRSPGPLGLHLRLGGRRVVARPGTGVHRRARAQWEKGGDVAASPARARSPGVNSAADTIAIAPIAAPRAQTPAQCHWP